MSYAPPRQRTDRSALIVEAALSYVGARFHHQGRHVDMIDCIGLVVLSHRDVGYVIDDHTAYHRRPDPKVLLAYIERNFERVDDTPAPGRVGIFQYRAGKPKHASIFTDGTWGMVHTWADVGKVVHNLNDTRWRPMLHSVWQVKDERWQP